MNEIESESTEPRADIDTVDRLRETVPWVGIALLYALTVLGGLAMHPGFEAAGLIAFDDPGDVGNVGVFAVEVIAFTAVILVAQRLGIGMTLLQVGMAAVFGLVIAHLVLVVTGGTVSGATLAGVPTTPLPVAAGLATVIVLLVHPEWYVIDVVAVLAGIALVPELGLSFGPLPIVVLLVGWAGYDAYSVYVSGHMQSLVGAVGDLKMPMFYVVPADPGFRFREFDLDVGDDAGADTDEGGDTPELAVLGLGDAIIPGMLAVSAAVFLDAPTVVPVLSANLPAIGALVGGVVGVVALIGLTARTERAHAGLPVLNTGVLAGYLVGALAAGVPVTTAVGL